MKIYRADELGFVIREEMSRIFVDGFYQWLHYFSKDKEKLRNAFAHIFTLEVFYVVEEEGGILGMLACADGKVPTVRLVKREFTTHLGLIRGSIAYKVLKGEFVDKSYPFEIPEGMGMIEFVATSKDHRGKGVASTLIRHVFALPFSPYVLEVADTNTAAIHVYEKMGFREFLRIPQKHSEKSGVNFLVYMKTESQ